MKATLRSEMDDRRDDYARSFTQSAKELAKHNVYHKMAGMLGIAQRYQQAKHSIPDNEPIMHIDYGSGTADLLRELSKFHAETPHIFIGVEGNERLASHSANESAMQRMKVETHIGRGVEIKKENGNDVAHVSFEPDQKIIDEMNVTPDGRIIIVRDDARSSMKVLCAVLDKMKRQGIPRVSSTSITLSGLSGDMAYWEEPRWRRKSYNDFLIEKTERMTTEMVQNVTTFTREHLDETGIFFLAQRLNLTALRKMWESMQTNPFPEDEQEANGIFMAGSQQLILGEQADAFKTRVFSVLVQDLEAIERNTMVNYGFSSFGRGHMRNAPEGAERSLVAMALVKK